MGYHEEEWTDGTIAEILHGSIEYPKPCLDMYRLLEEAVDDWPEFGTDEDVPGAELVDWYSRFWRDAARILAKVDPRRDPPPEDE